MVGFNTYKILILIGRSLPDGGFPADDPHGHYGGPVAPGRHSHHFQQHQQQQQHQGYTPGAWRNAGASSGPGAGLQAPGSRR